jgi:hypothetical protein
VRCRELSVVREWTHFSASHSRSDNEVSHGRGVCQTSKVLHMGHLKSFRICPICRPKISHITDQKSHDVVGQLILCSMSLQTMCWESRFVLDANKLLLQTIWHDWLTRKLTSNVDFESLRLSRAVLCCRCSQSDHSQILLR